MDTTKLDRIVKGFIEIDFEKSKAMQNIKTGEVAPVVKWLNEVIVAIDTVEGRQYHNIEFSSDWEFIF